MSYGVVACSACRREVHQDGPYELPFAPPGFKRATWRHCEDKTPQCAAAEATYLSQLSGPPVGRFCNLDRGPDERPR